MDQPPPEPANRSAWEPVKYVVLSLLIVVWMGVVYAGLIKRGPTWPIFVILTCIGPLILVTVISLARAAAWIVLRVFQRRRID